LRLDLGNVSIRRPSARVKQATHIFTDIAAWYLDLYVESTQRDAILQDYMLTSTRLTTCKNYVNIIAIPNSTLIHDVACVRGPTSSRKSAERQVLSLCFVLAMTLILVVVARVHRSQKRVAAPFLQDILRWRVTATIPVNKCWCYI
jgi:hypothetical protein